MSKYKALGKMPISNVEITFSLPLSELGNKMLEILEWLSSWLFALRMEDCTLTTATGMP